MHVLVIGGGPVPHTAIRIARETGASVITLDNREKAVKLADRCICKFGIQGNVESVYGDGMTYSLKGIDIIWITLYVQPKSEVVSRVLQDARSGTRIVVMQANSLMERIFSPVKPFDRSVYEPVEIGPRNIFMSYRTYLYDK